MSGLWAERSGGLGKGCSCLCLREGLGAGEEWPSAEHVLGWIGKGDQCWWPVPWPESRSSLQTWEVVAGSSETGSELLLGWVWPGSSVPSKTGFGPRCKVQKWSLISLSPVPVASLCQGLPGRGQCSNLAFPSIRSREERGTSCVLRWELSLSQSQPHVSRWQASCLWVLLQKMHGCIGKCLGLVGLKSLH